MVMMMIAVLIVVNVLAFILYGMDKSRARHHQWRIPEKTLIGIAMIGGSVGAILGMFLFRHKTRHWYFRYGIPAMLVIQIVLAGILLGRIVV